MSVLYQDYTLFVNTARSAAFYNLIEMLHKILTYKAQFNSIPSNIFLEKYADQPHICHGLTKSPSFLGPCSRLYQMTRQRIKHRFENFKFTTF